MASTVKPFHFLRFSFDYTLSSHFAQDCVENVHHLKLLCPLPQAGSKNQKKLLFQGHQYIGTILH